jgi:hypothetical protein
MSGKAKAANQPEPTDIEDDVEGHNMLVDPSMARNMAASRSREIERHVREEQRAREARNSDQKRR